MRILFVLHQFYPEFSGGTEHVTLNLARMAQRGGHRVQVLACTNAESLPGDLPDDTIPGARRRVHDGLPVLLLPRAALPPTADIGFDAQPELVDPLAAWMRAQQFDVAHVLHTMRMGTAVLALQKAEVPYLVTATDFFLPCARINLINAAGQSCPGPEQGARCARDCMAAPWTAASYAARYQQARAMLAAAGERTVPSDYVARHLRDAFPGLSFRVVPHGIDLLALCRHAAAAKPRDPEAPLALAYVGSVIPQKGLDVLLRALAQLPGRKLRLEVIGGFYGNTGYHAEVQALAERDPRVTLRGKLPSTEVFAALQSADLLCLPSRVPESFSLAVQESAAAGVPALVSDLGAPPDFVGRHGCGEAVPAGDADAWAAAIARVLDTPSQLDAWRAALPLPLRVEEEAFFYESLYRRLRRA